MRLSSQQRAVKNYRKRLDERGLTRFEVLGLDSDRELIRTMARQLAAGDAEAARLRTKARLALVGETGPVGGILAALRRSPLVGANLELARPLSRGRKVRL
jgi:hypothetical protein